MENLLKAPRSLAIAIVEQILLNLKKRKKHTIKSRITLRIMLLRNNGGRFFWNILLEKSIQNCCINEYLLIQWIRGSWIVNVDLCLTRIYVGLKKNFFRFMNCLGIVGKSISNRVNKKRHDWNYFAFFATSWIAKILPFINSLWNELIGFGVYISDRTSII